MADQVQPDAGEGREESSSGLLLSVDPIEGATQHKLSGDDSDSDKGGLLGDDSSDADSSDSSDAGDSDDSDSGEGSDADGTDAEDADGEDTGLDADGTDPLGIQPENADGADPSKDRAMPAHDGEDEEDA